MLRGILVAIVLIAAALLLTTCGGSHRVAPSIQTADPSLDSALAELAAYPTPDGVDAELFAQLKDALEEALKCRAATNIGGAGACPPSRVARDRRVPPVIQASGEKAGRGDPALQAKFASTPPTGDENRVTDLAITDNGDETYTLSWHYRNLGDYDQNGTVGISDITPIAMHYGETYDPETEPNCLLSVIDGSGNGEIDIADITPIAMCYGVELDAYIVVGDDTWQGPFTEVDTISIGEATGDERKQFSYLLDPPEYEYYRVVPRDSLGEHGEPSSIVAVHGGEGPSITSLSPTSGFAGSEVTFAAEVSGDAPFIYQWNFGGGAIPNTSSQSSPTVTLGPAGSYSASLNVENAFGTDQRSFTLSVASPGEAPSIEAVWMTDFISGSFCTFSLTVTGTSPTSYSWDFGGGATPNTSTQASPTVSLGFPGTYAGTVYVANSHGSDSTAFGYTVYPAGNLFAILDGNAVIIADDFTYLGLISSNEFLYESIMNEFGPYGSPYSTTSIFNEFGMYGSLFSNLSPWNDFATQPPLIFLGDIFVAYLTTNAFKTPRIDPHELVAYLESH